MITKNERKVKWYDIAPTWEDSWKLWLKLGKIDQNTFDLFLPVMLLQDERNKEGKDKTE